MKKNKVIVILSHAGIGLMIGAVLLIIMELAVTPPEQKLFSTFSVIVNWVIVGIFTILGAASGLRSAQKYRG